MLFLKLLSKNTKADSKPIMELESALIINNSFSDKNTYIPVVNSFVAPYAVPTSLVAYALT